MLDCVPGRLITFTHENIVGVYNKMAQYAQDFQTQSQGLLSYIQSQLASVVSWTALPGQLNKIVASPTGFVWGFNSAGEVYTCKEPCDGQNWKYVSPPPGRTGMPADIAVDGDNVYILYTTTVSSPNLTGTWNMGKIVQTGNTWVLTPTTTANGWTAVTGTFESGSTTSGKLVYSTPNGPLNMTFTIDSTGKTITGSNGGTFTRSTASTSGITDLGCWKDGPRRALSGPPQQYGYTPQTCKEFALTRGTDIFALQDGGWCVTKKAGDDHTRYGKATGPCPERGAGWINHVYQATQEPDAGPITVNQLSFSMRPVDGGGNWSEPKAVPGTPSATPSINVTDQFIFVGSQGCSKPCTTNSWVPISQPAGSQGIVAASGGSTYASATSAGGGQAVYQSSANGQGGWKEQAGLAGVIPLAVEGDNKFILGVSQSSQRPVRCSQPYTNENSCKIDPTITYKPMPGLHTMSLNPRSYQTYVAAASSGPSGNIYQRVDPGSIDNSAALDQTTQYTSKMDNNVNALGTAATNQYAMIEVAKVKKEADAVIKQITDISEERQSTAHERENIKRKIETVGGPVSQWKIQVLQIIAVTLALVLVTYFGLGFIVPPVVNMSIAVVGMSVGLGFAIYFAVNKQ